MILSKDIAKLVNGNLIGNPNILIEGACNIKKGKKNHIAFLGNPKYKD